ncbi:lysophospholipid acyltransferase family protein [Planktotalea sp.]|uniref:lysophospholipid acyltransferase family protein n=1 Tax=Planktotalea sp. TaxID=2029877 RepID=UPI003D6A33D0
MVEQTQRPTTLSQPVRAANAAANNAPYDKRKLSYANTFTNPWKANLIRVMEWTTGKIPLIRLVRRFERTGAEDGQGFWSQALGHMGIELRTSDAEIANIPATGPVIVVANHPHGLVDGMILAELIGRVRTDYRILTRSLLTGVSEIEEFMIPVPFPHEEDAREQFLDMRRRAMAHLDDDGVIVLFPSGVVASSETWFGPAIEQQWNPFTAKMIQRSGAVVVPIHFPGQNSRAYQIANRISATLRQGLLIHEVMHACGKPQHPIVGAPIPKEKIKELSSNPRGLVAWLREHTMGLGKS